MRWEGEGSQAGLALSLNLPRRHLDESQRALVAARLAKLMEVEGVKRRGRRREENPANLQGTLAGGAAGEGGGTVLPIEAPAAASITTQ